MLDYPNIIKFEDVSRPINTQEDILKLINNSASRTTEIVRRALKSLDYIEVLFSWNGSEWKTVEIVHNSEVVNQSGNDIIDIYKIIPPEKAGSFINQEVVIKCYPKNFQNVNIDLVTMNKVTTAKF